MYYPQYSKTKSNQYNVNIQTSKFSRSLPAREVGSCHNVWLVVGFVISANAIDPVVYNGDWLHVAKKYLVSPHS